jgi:hypothetical protein
MEARHDRAAEVLLDRPRPRRSSQRPTCRARRRQEQPATTGATPMR